MTREEIINKVVSTLSEEFNVNKELIVPDALINETLDLDSLDFVELVTIMQYTFKVKISLESLPKIYTFNDMYNYIEKHLS